MQPHASENSSTTWNVRGFTAIDRAIVKDNVYRMGRTVDDDDAFPINQLEQCEDMQTRGSIMFRGRGTWGRDNEEEVTARSPISVSISAPLASTPVPRILERNIFSL